MSVMLAYNATYWGQFGWNKHKSGSTFVREIFQEHRDGMGNDFWNTWAGKTVWTSTNYEITYNPSNKHLDYFVNGSQYSDLGTNWTPNNYQVFSETQDLADQMPGNVTSHALLASTYVSLHGISGWSAPSGDTVHFYSPTSYATKVGANEYDTWDTNCP